MRGVVERWKPSAGVIPLRRGAGLADLAARPELRTFMSQWTDGVSGQRLEALGPGEWRPGRSGQPQRRPELMQETACFMSWSVITLMKSLWSVMALCCCPWKPSTAKFGAAGVL